jgi:hypothetical protein
MPILTVFEIIDNSSCLFVRHRSLDGRLKQVLANLSIVESRRNFIDRQKPVSIICRRLNSSVSNRRGYVSFAYLILSVFSEPEMANATVGGCVERLLSSRGPKKTVTGDLRSAVSAGSETRAEPFC